MPLMSVENELELEEESSHKFHIWSPFTVEINKDYDFVPTSPCFCFVSHLLSYFAYGVLSIFNRFVFGFRIEGKENLKKIKGGKVTISNHIHPMDCTMIGIAHFPTPIYFPTLESNFGIPLARHFIRLLHGIPIPNKISAKAKFVQSIDTLLQQGHTIHFYPEGSLWPYHNQIRHFKDGAFRFCVQNNVPIIPMVYKLKENTNLLKILKKKPSITLSILEPIFPNQTLPFNTSIEVLKENAYEEMKKELTR